MNTIITTQIIHIAPEYQRLIALLIKYNGGMLEGETPQVSVARILNKIILEATFNSISPFLSMYYGEQGADTVATVNNILLNGAIQIGTIIE